jgi:hypothetical protein
MGGKAAQVMVGGAVAHPSLHSGQAPAATPEVWSKMYDRK